MGSREIAVETQKLFIRLNEGRKYSGGGSANRPLLASDASSDLSPISPWREMGPMRPCSSGE